MKCLTCQLEEKMKKAAVLGSTGSIGINTLNVIENIEGYEVTVLSANLNYKLLHRQAEKFKPKYIYTGTKDGYDYLKRELSYKNAEILYGENEIKKLGEIEEYDVLVNAVSGTAALETTISALKNKKRIALANKEILVSAGEIIMKLVNEGFGEIIPVDSEHSAVFQALKSGKKEEIRRIILTASGGAFRDYNIEKLKNVKLEDALKHPNWKMGKKITVDSATLVNKGLEVIEAKHLFGVEYEKIDVIMHPESVIHSMIEYVDNSIIAQIGPPDMRIPIQYALTYPERVENKSSEVFDFMKYSSLNFKKIDRTIFKGLDFAYYAGNIGKSMPAVLNAANEIAVESFIKGKIKFLDIYKVIDEVMGKHIPEKMDSIEKVLFVDRETREKTKEYIKTLV